MKPASGRQTKFALGVLSGLSASEAARQAGYGPAYSKKSTVKLLKLPAVAAIIESGREDLREKTMFDLTAAVAECNSQINRALSDKSPNHMAAAKLLALKCELHGLLVQKFEVKSFVDIGAALLEARQRVQGPVQINSTAISVPEQQTHIAHARNEADIFS